MISATYNSSTVASWKVHNQHSLNLTQRNKLSTMHIPYSVHWIQNTQQTNTPTRVHYTFLKPFRSNTSTQHTSCKTYVATIYKHSWLHQQHQHIATKSHTSVRFCLDKMPSMHCILSNITNQVAQSWHWQTNLLPLTYTVLLSKRKSLNSWSYYKRWQLTKTVGSILTKYIRQHTRTILPMKSVRA